MICNCAKKEGQKSNLKIDEQAFANTRNWILSQIWRLDMIAEFYQSSTIEVVLITIFQLKTLVNNFFTSTRISSQKCADSVFYSSAFHCNPHCDLDLLDAVHSASAFFPLHFFKVH